MLYIKRSDNNKILEIEFTPTHYCPIKKQPSIRKA